MSSLNQQNKSMGLYKRSTLSQSYKVIDNISDKQRVIIDNAKILETNLKKKAEINKAIKLRSKTLNFTPDMKSLSELKQDLIIVNHAISDAKILNRSLGNVKKFFTKI